MQRDQAFRDAKRHAVKKQETRFVIYEAGEYEHGSEYDLDTFYCGAEVVGEVNP